MNTYIVWIERKENFTGNAIPGHREFLKGLKKSDKLILAGGFLDQTGGAYVLKALSIVKAKEIVSADPMNQNDECIYNVKEWNVV
ncbi:YciI family protein [Salipaludibacillus sp. CF4.18]|uniref:YciI family protein n=1 Tax=Salipaludibacillus sp. CF4.18 TaxID=3373081 RepID=UPI003EE4D1CB